MKTILVPVDFSDVTLRVVETARGMAQALGAKIVLLHVFVPEPEFIGYEPGPLPVRVGAVRDFNEEQQKLEDLKAVLTGLGDVTALHIQGPAAQTILSEADKLGAGLIVIGSHGHGAFFELIVGSVTNGVLKGAKCPVLVVPATRA